MKKNNLYLLTTIVLFVCNVNTFCQNNNVGYYSIAGEVDTVEKFSVSKKQVVWKITFKDTSFYQEIYYRNNHRALALEYETGEYFEIVYKNSIFSESNKYYTEQKYLKRETNYIKYSDSIGYVVHGKYHMYYPNGNIRENGSFKNGDYHGRLERFYQNRERANISFFSNGRCHGKWRTYYDNGEIWFKGRYKNNGRKGLWHEYYTNGNVKETGKYCMDIEPIDVTMYNVDSLVILFNDESIKYKLWKTVDFKSGKWEYFDEEGKLVKEEFYEKGKLVKAIDY